MQRIIALSVGIAAIGAIGDDYVMGIHGGKLGVEYLQVHRIVKPASTDNSWCGVPGPHFFD